jgi:tripartite-type tricarboxylate transporter receptor subunit TctC
MQSGEDMTMSRGRSLRIGAIMVAALAQAPVAFAQGAESWPAKGLAITVPYQAGGTADAIPRILGEKLTHRLKQPVIIENRPGASGSIGSAYVFRAPPDGYTLLSAPSSPIIVNQFIQKSMGYDPEKLTPVAFLAVAPLVLTVRSDFPAKDLREFVDYVGANAAKVNYASNGVGGSAHIGTLLLQKAAGISGLTHIPYNGAAPALTALLAGDAQFYIDNLSSTLQFVQAGKMRVLAVGSRERSPSLPDVPTFEEQGFKDLILVTWFGMFAPPATPAPIAARLNQEIRQALQDGEVGDKFQKLGLQIVQNSPEEMRVSVDRDRARWRVAIEEANIPKN